MKFLSHFILTAVGTLLILETLRIRPYLAVAFVLDWLGQLGSHSLENLWDCDENATSRNRLTSFETSFHHADGTLIQAYHQPTPWQADRSSYCLTDADIDLELSNSLNELPENSLILSVSEEVTFLTAIPFPSLGIYIDQTEYGKQFSLLPLAFDGLRNFSDESHHTPTERETLETGQQERSNDDDTILTQLTQPVMPTPTHQLGMLAISAVALLSKSGRFTVRKGTVRLNAQASAKHQLLVSQRTNPNNTLA